MMCDYRVEPLSLTEAKYQPLNRKVDWEEVIAWVVFSPILSGPVGCGIGNDGKLGGLIGFFWGAIIGVFPVLFIYYMIESTKCEDEKEKYRSDFLNRLNSEAQTLSESLKQNINNCLNLLDNLPQHLATAAGYLNKACTDFNEKAYGPFWENIEGAALAFGRFKQDLDSLRYGSNDYYDKLANRRHTFPQYPAVQATFPDPGSVMQEFARIVRMGQTDYQFASIWEQRRTQKILIDGFSSLEDAVSNLSYRIDSGFQSLQTALRSGFQSVQTAVSSGVHSLAESQARQQKAYDKQLGRQQQALSNQSKALDEIRRIIKN